MQAPLKKLLSALFVAATSSVWACAATAQTTQTNTARFAPIRVQRISDTFNQAFFNESEDFYTNRSIGRQIDFLIGTGLPGRAAYPELEIERDAQLINILYSDVLEQQVASDPILRTLDLPNPYNTSLRVFPEYRSFGNRTEGSEFFLETLPPQ
jgi:hypothetical protein